MCKYVLSQSNNHINVNSLSLTILGQVISALAQNKKHVPFRDSVLTHALKDSLGGNCKTTLIVCGTKHMFNREETINSLRFGARCKMITHNVTANKVYSNADLMRMMEKLKKENQKLSQMLQNKGFSATNDHQPKSTKTTLISNEKYLSQIKQLKQKNNALDDKNHHLQVQNHRLEEKNFSLMEESDAKTRKNTALNARLTHYHSLTHQQQEDVNRVEIENQQLRTSMCH